MVKALLEAIEEMTLENLSKASTKRSGGLVSRKCMCEMCQCVCCLMVSTFCSKPTSGGYIQYITTLTSSQV